MGYNPCYAAMTTVLCRSSLREAVFPVSLR